MYYNYHGIIKNKIKDNELIKIEFVLKYHNINNVMLLYFNDGTVKPIREHRWLEYFLLLEKYNYDYSLLLKKDKTWALSFFDIILFINLDYCVIWEMIRSNNFWDVCFYDFNILGSENVINFYSWINWWKWKKWFFKNSCSIK